jgi:anti-anti-sigma factor
MMEMLEARRNDVLVLALKGRLDAVSAPSVRNRLQERIEQGERRLAVDAAGLTYVSSSGLRLLLQVAKHLEERSRTDGAVCSSGARKACLGNCRFQLAIQHIQLVGGSHSVLPARLKLFEPSMRGLLLGSAERTKNDGHRIRRSKNL